MITDMQVLLRMPVVGSTAGNLSFRKRCTPLSSHAAAGRDRPARYERATPRWARSVRAQPVTDLAPYAPVGAVVLD